MPFSSYMPPASPAEVTAVHRMIHVTPAMIRYDTAQVALGLTAPLLELVVLAALLFCGFGARAGAAASALARGRTFWAGVAFWVAVHAIVAAALFPTTFYGSYVLAHRYGLSNQHLPAWLGDYFKDWLVSVVIGAPIAAGCLVLIRRAPRKWPIIAAFVLVPIVAVGIFATPLVIDPLFNKFTPMRSSDPLYFRIEQLSAKAGIEHAEIFVVDKSKQTNETNAYVTGLGPTTRIVIWDTLIRRMPPDQVGSVVAHEMGHYTEHHVEIGFAVTVLSLFAVLPLIRFIALRAIGRWGKRWRIESLDQPAGLLVLLLTVNAVALVASPIAAAASRVIEHRADAFGIALTGDRVTFAKSMVALSADNLASPYPPRWLTILMDHPPLGERIDFALTGQPSALRPPPNIPTASTTSAGPSRRL